MNTELLKSIILIIVQIFSICLASYYLGMELLVLALIIKNQAIKVFLKVRREPQLEKQGEEKWSLRNLYKKSLFFNHTLAILTISFVALITSQFSTLSSFVKLEIFTILVSLLPYIFSFKRATNVGINGALLGQSLD